jgi:hypothetical protein
MWLSKFRGTIDTIEKHVIHRDVANKQTTRRNNKVQTYGNGGSMGFDFCYIQSYNYNCNGTQIQWCVLKRSFVIFRVWVCSGKIFLSRTDF